MFLLMLCIFFQKAWYKPFFYFSKNIYYLNIRTPGVNPHMCICRYEHTNQHTMIQLTYNQHRVPQCDEQCTDQSWAVVVVSVSESAVEGLGSSACWVSPWVPLSDGSLVPVGSRGTGVGGGEGLAGSTSVIPEQFICKNDIHILKSLTNGSFLLHIMYLCPFLYWLQSEN